MSDGGKLRFGHAASKAFDLVVARMYFHNQRRVIANPCRKIPRVCAISCAYLAQLAASALHDLGDAERAANLD